MADDPDRLNKLISGAKVKLKAAIETTLNEFKVMYDALDNYQQRQLKEWIGHAVTLRQQAESLSPRIVLYVQFSHLVDHEEVAAKMSVFAASNAIESWDRGEVYFPKFLDEFYG